MLWDPIVFNKIIIIMKIFMFEIPSLISVHRMYFVYTEWRTYVFLSVCRYCRSKHVNLYTYQVGLKPMVKWTFKWNKLPSACLLTYLEKNSVLWLCMYVLKSETIFYITSIRLSGLYCSAFSGQGIFSNLLDLLIITPTIFIINCS